MNTRSIIYITVGITLLAGVVGFAQVNGSSLWNHLLNSATVAEVIGHTTQHATRYKMFPTPYDLRKGLRISRDSNEDIQLGSHKLSYETAKALLVPLVSQPQILEQAYSIYAVPLCRSFKTKIAEVKRDKLDDYAKNLDQVVQGGREDREALNAFLRILETKGETAFLIVYNDISSGMFDRMKKHLDGLASQFFQSREDHYEKREAQGLKGTDAPFAEHWKKVEDARIAMANAAYNGATAPDLKLTEGFTQLEVELAKHTFYLAGRQTYLMSLLGLKPTPVARDGHGFVWFYFIPTEFVWGTPGFVIRRCVDATTQGQSCKTIATKWKELFDRFSDLLSKNCNS